MSELDKKGSAWPWIVVPVVAVVLFFALRECRQSLPPAEHAPEPGVAQPAAATADATPAPSPASQ